MGKICNNNCSVYGCKSIKRKEPNLHFHHYPRTNSGTVDMVNRFGITEKIDRRKAWIIKLKMCKPVGSSMQVCSKHFTKEDYFPGLNKQRHPRLKCTAVPSLNLPKLQNKKVSETVTSKENMLMDTEDKVSKMEEETMSEDKTEVVKCRTKPTCCVPGCTSIRVNNKNLSFHKFPSPNEFMVVENDVKQNRRKLWEVRLKLGKKIAEHMTVCSLHFTKENFYPKGCFKRRILLPDVVPTQNLPLSNLDEKQYEESKSLEQEITDHDEISVSDELSKRSDIVEAEANKPSQYSKKSYKSSSRNIQSSFPPKELEKSKSSMCTTTSPIDYNPLNTETICRSCLGEEGVFQSIFNIDESLNLNVSFADIINTSISPTVNITNHDGLPNKICSDCTQKVLELHKFKINIEKSAQILKTRISSLIHNVTNPESFQFVQSYEDISEQALSIKQEVEDLLIKEEVLDHDLSTVEFNDTECKMDDIDITEYNVKFEEIIEDNSQGEIDQIEDSSNYDLYEVKKEENLDSNHHELYENAIWEDQKDYEVNKVIENPEEVNEENYSLEHTEKQSLECEQCDKKFAQRHSLTRHLLVHQNGKPFECKQCHKQFSKNTTLQDHLLAHVQPSEKPQFKCELCSKIFMKRSYLQNHSLTHSRGKFFECEQCDKKFSHENTLKHHLNVHTGEQQFQCEFCNKIFTKINYLQTHVLLHTGEKPFVCEHCGKRFSQKSNLSTHLILHTGEKAFVCEVCNRRFSQKSALKTHILTHTGEKSFECDICNKKFAHKSNLNSHLLTHSGKQFECEKCNKKFSRKNYLQEHYLNSIDCNEIEYFPCEQCDKKFKKQSSLKEHSLVHTDDKGLLECEHCKKTFSFRSSLHRHLLKHANDNT